MAYAEIVMAIPMSGADRDPDARWAVHAQRLRAAYRSIYLFLPMIFVGAISGAAVGPVWGGTLPTPAPHAIAIGLAAISLAVLAGAIWLRWRHQPRSETIGLRKPHANSKGALLLAEASREQQHVLIVIYVFGLLLLSFQRLGHVGRLPWDLFVLGPMAMLGALALAVTFGGGTRKDEFFTATRAQAMQIGYWTALAILLALATAAAFGWDVAPLLTPALAAAVAVPCLSFLALSARGGRDE